MNRTAHDTRWMAAAACRGMDTNVFFPAAPIDARNAQQVCATCRVRDECATHAMTTREARGIWGGLTEHERAGLHRATWETEPGRRRPGPDPQVDDRHLIEALRAADPTRPAAGQLRDRFGISVPTAYKYLQRALALGAAERRGRILYPTRWPARR